MYGLNGLLCASLGYTTASHAKIFFICLVFVFAFFVVLVLLLNFDVFFGGGSVGRAEIGSKGMRNE